MLLTTCTALFAETTVCNVNQMTRTDVAPVTIQCTAGKLAELINAESLSIATITDLVVTGTINQIDLATMKDDMTALANIDLSGTTVEGCTNAGTSYAANEIPKQVFNYKQELISIKLPSNITKIGQKAFIGCESITTVSMPNTVIAIDDSAFLGCDLLTTVNLSTALQNIGNDCFNGCPALTNLTFGPNLKSIGNTVFMNCSSITEFKLPEGLTTVGVAAFAMCKALKSVFIPSTLSALNVSLFQGDASLEKIVNFSQTPQVFIPQVFEGVPFVTCKVFVPIGTVDAYAAVDMWRQFTTIAEYNPTAIQSTTAKTQLSFSNNKLTISSDKVMELVEVMSFDGKLLSRQHCNNTSCSIDVKGESKVIAKIVYHDGTSQTNKIIGRR